MFSKNSDENLKTVRKIKVLQLIEALEIGGMERIIGVITCGLDRKKYNVEIWCIAKGGEIADELKDKGVKVRILNIFTYHNPFNILKLTFLLKKSKPDIVHTHGYFASTIGRIAAKLAGVPIIISHMHSTYWEYRKKHILMERFLNIFTHKIICCSKAVEEFVKSYERIKPSKTVVIYNGINEDRFSQPKNISSIKALFKINLSDPVVGTIASLTPHKGHKYLLEAAVKVLDTFPNSKFLIVGEGALRKELEQKVYNLNITSNIIFTGRRKEVANLLSIMDVVVLPSCIREGMPMSIIEAMAAGKPVVATNIGGIPEVVKDRETGLLVEPKSSSSLASAITRLLRDKEYATSLGETGKKHAEKFSSSIMAEKIEEIYNYYIDLKISKLEKEGCKFVRQQE